MRFDAVVVGAGPAGLVAARAIAGRGLRVAVLEKERRLGVKPCGEGCSVATLVDSMVDPKGDYVVREIKGALIYAPDGRNVSILGGAGVGCILDKALFLEELAARASEAGAEIHVNTPASDLKRSDGSVRVEAHGDELETGLILGADGFNSTVSRKFGLEKPGERELIPCVQYHMVNCDFDDEVVVEFHLGREVAPLGYAWAFPKGNGRGNIGIGVRGTQAKPYLDKFLKDHPRVFEKAQIIGIEAAPVTIGGTLHEIVDDNVMLVGEAAGQVIPLTGGGIHSGVVAGQMAAQTAVDALEEGDLSKETLMRYPRHYDERWGRRIRDSRKALTVLEQLSDEDMNKLAEVLDSSDILDLANGLDVGRVAKRFLGHPVLGLKLARALLAG